MRRTSATTLALAAVAALAAAPADGAPELTDPCGDAGTMVEVARQPLVDVPDAERAGGFDIASASLADSEDGTGVVITLDLCGAVPAPHPGSRWSVHWRTAEDCAAAVRITDRFVTSAPTSPERLVSFDGWCWRPSDLPPGDWVESYEVFEYDLPASSVVIAGDVITWSLPAASFTGEAAAVLTAGTVWAEPSASTFDGRRGTHAWSRDADGRHDYHVSGPGAADDAWQGRDFTVGGDDAA